MRTIGILPSTSSIVAEVRANTPAARAGLQKDDVVTEINGEKLFSPNALYEYLKDHPTGPYQLTVLRAGKALSLPFDPLGAKVDEVEKDSPASAAGLQKGDVIVGMDGEKTRDIYQLTAYVGQRAGTPIVLHVERAGKGIPDIKVTPQIPTSSDPEIAKKAKIGLVLEETDGVMFEQGGKSQLVHPGPVEQIHLSMMAIVNTLDAVLSRKSSVGVQQMGGPVMMMNAYYHMLSAPEGLKIAIWFSVILNVNLALLNLLPIPVLDGGHIVLSIIEAVRRKPMNVRVLEYVQTACALVIISFMLFIMFFDVQDLPFLGAKRPTMHFQKVTEEPAK
jgi:regulator of sigma E protease